MCVVLNLSYTSYNQTIQFHNSITVLLAKSDSYVMFCLQNYQGLESTDYLCINPIRRIGLILKWSIDSH